MGLSMEQQVLEEALRRVAEATRAACVRAAADGYERAGLGGLCEAGRWEMALDSIQSLDVKAIIGELSKVSSEASGADERDRAS